MLQVSLKFIQASPHWSGEKGTEIRLNVQITLLTPLYILYDNFFSFSRKTVKTTDSWTHPPIEVYLSEMIKIAMICQQGETCEVVWWVTKQEVERFIKQYTGGLLHSRMIDREPTVSQHIRIQTIIGIKWLATNVNTLRIQFIIQINIIPAYRKHQHRDYIHKTLHVIYVATKQTTSTCYNY